MINKTRLAFWYAKTAKSFNGAIAPCPSIHSVINSKVKASVGAGYSCNLNNSLALIKSKRKRMSCKEALMELIGSPNHGRRCQKWLNKLK